MSGVPISNLDHYECTQVIEKLYLVDEFNMIKNNSIEFLQQLIEELMRNEKTRDFINTQLQLVEKRRKGEETEDERDEKLIFIEIEKSNKEIGRAHV